MNTTARFPDAPALKRRTALAATLLMPSLCPSLVRARPERPQLDVPYVPTPMPIVQKMLEMAQVGPGDMLYDLGCGDGRIVITAAQERGARGVGIDLDPARIAEAKASAVSARVTDRTRFVVADLFETDFSDATVVTLYLLPQLNIRLRPQLWRQLRVGTRVVSHDFHMGNEWPPERTEIVDDATIYRWTIAKKHKSMS